MLILVQSYTNRLQYLFNWMFAGAPGIEYRLTTDREEFIVYNGPKFQYGGIPVSNDHLYWGSSGLLAETGIREQAVDSGAGKRLFLLPAEAAGSHDPFSACFYLLTRYEEYLSFRADQDGRFEADQSILSRKGMLDYPLTDALKQEVIAKLQSRFPELKYSAFPFRVTVTIDIDQAFKFSGKSRVRTLGSMMKSCFFGWASLRTHLQVLRAMMPDPYDTFDFLLNELQGRQLEYVFFLLCRTGTKYDRQVTLEHPIFKSLVKKLVSISDIGVHPSYYSQEITGQLESEIDLVQSLTGKKVYRSRQHYLRLLIPHTYRRLLAADITEDYSMGFSSAPGFRAGTCSPFLWYDLEREVSTPLKIFPVTFMEGTFAEVQCLAAEAAWDRMQTLMTTVKTFSGHFVPIWHNHTVSKTKEWESWRNIFIKMIHSLEPHS